ncbi:MAG: hypothetical protein JNG90_16580, partial [Planctomycetaceae bacterium]|nr:hypothetical protein [Planctomycetaceae bacterium]
MSRTAGRPSCWRLASALLGLAAVGALAPAPGAEPQHAPQNPATSFRRILVPAGEEARWPVGTQRYLAVEPAEFDRLYRAASSRQPGESTPPAAHLKRATYTARLEGNGLVLGQGRWTIATEAQPSLVELGVCNLAIGEVRWSGAAPAASTPSGGAGASALEATNNETADPAPAASTSAASLGTQATGQLALLAPSSGELEFA